MTRVSARLEALFTTRFARFFLAIMFVACSASIASAYLLTWRYTGQGYFGWYPEDIRPISFTLTINSDLPNYFANPAWANVICPGMSPERYGYYSGFGTTSSQLTWGQSTWNTGGFITEVNEFLSAVCMPETGDVHYSNWAGNWGFPTLYTTFGNPTPDSGAQPLTPPAGGDGWLFTLAYPPYEYRGFLFFSLSSVEVVPEPASLLLLGAGLAGLVAVRRYWR